MKVYTYKGNEYHSLFAIRRKFPNLIFSNDASANLLREIGIIAIEKSDPTPPEPTEEEKLEEAKINRSIQVHELVVEIDGMEFDADETAQRRMCNAILAAKTNNNETVNWVLHDNTVASVSIDQLRRAHALAITKMSEIWTSVYMESDNVN